MIFGKSIKKLAVPRLFIAPDIVRIAADNRNNFDYLFKIIQSDYYNHLQN